MSQDKKLKLCATQKGVELWSYHNTHYIVRSGIKEVTFQRWPKALRYFKWEVLMKTPNVPTIKTDGSTMTCLLIPGSLKIELKEITPTNIEVVFITWGEAKEIKGKFVDAGYRRPNLRDWGDNGWTFQESTEAFWHFHSLIYDHMKLERKAKWVCPDDWDRRNGPDYYWRSGKTPPTAVLTPSDDQNAPVNVTPVLQ